MLRASARAARRARHGAPKRATSSQSEAAAARSDRCAPDRPRARAVPPRCAPPDDSPPLETCRATRSPAIRRRTQPRPPTPALALAPPFSQNRASRRRERRRERRRVQPHDPRRPPVDARRPHVDARRPPRRHGGDDEPPPRRCPTTSRAVGPPRATRSPPSLAAPPRVPSSPGSTLTPAPARTPPRGSARCGPSRARVAASGVFSSAGGSSAAVARVSAGPARFAAAVFANLRAPSALFVLGHHARDAVLARRLPNFSGVLVMLLVGGRGFAPATRSASRDARLAARTRERETARPPTRDRDRSVECWFPPTGRSARGWTAYPPLFRDLVERALWPGRRCTSRCSSRRRWRSRRCCCTRAETPARRCGIVFCVARSNSAARRSSSGGSGRARGTTCSPRNCAGNSRSFRRARRNTAGGARNKS